MGKATIGIGLVGLGTVGGSVADEIAAHGELLSKRAGVELRLARVCDLDVSRKKKPLPPSVPHDIPLDADFKDLIASPDVHVVIELIGGTGAAKEVVLQALSAKKAVVTANKALLAKFGDEIFGKSAETGAPIGFEASVAGAIPILRSLREGIGGDDVYDIRGILNGTCNFILSKMTEEGGAFDDVLKEAQEAGYAEADPTFDVEGIDTAHKVTLLAGLSFGSRVRFEDVYTEGISKIEPEDIADAKRLGYRIKLLGIVKHKDGALELRVHPVMLPETEILARIGGPINGVEVHSRFIGQTVYTGPGAGGPPTAAAVLSDVVAIARAVAGDGGRIAPPRLLPEKDLAVIPVRPMGEIESAYYLRFTAKDQPGVLGKIAGYLGEAGVSIAQLQQALRSEYEGVPIPLLTHRCREAQVLEALRKIDKLDVVTAPTRFIRVEDERL